jgi:hypothetical protein
MFVCTLLLLLCLLARGGEARVFVHRKEGMFMLFFVVLLAYCAVYMSLFSIGGLRHHFWKLAAPVGVIIGNEEHSVVRGAFRL